MGVLACCLWWFVFGVLVGWLLNWLLAKFLRRDRPAAPGEAPDAHYPVAPHDAVGSWGAPLSAGRRDRLRRRVRPAVP